MHSASTREQALSLRLNGLSYTAIHAALHIPKSTLSDWFSKEPELQAITDMNRSLVKVAQANALRNFNKTRSVEYERVKEFELSAYASEITQLTNEQLFFLFLGMFWGEGSKKIACGLNITNSDPAFIKACIDFIERCLNINVLLLRGQVIVHSADNKTDAQQFWATLTGIPVARIRAYAYVSCASKGVRPSNLLPHGTFRVILHDVTLVRMIKGYFRGLQSIYTPE